MFCERDICYRYYAIPGYHSKELLSVHVFCKLILRSRLQKKQKHFFISMYRAYYVSSDNNLIYNQIFVGVVRGGLR
jgi:hypothetical protein